MTDSRHAYEDWHARLSVDSAADAPWHQMVLEALDPGRDLRDRRVLEMACGRGGFAVHLARFGTPRLLVAGDFALTAVAMGRRHAAGHGVGATAWIAGDAQHLAHADGTFDTVVSCETIEHVPDPRAALVEFARVLRPGGRLFLTTPNYLGTYGLYRIYRRLTGRPYTEEGQPINHVMLLPRTAAAVRRAGLRIERVAGTGHYLPLPGRVPPRWRWLDRVPGGTLFALHSLIVAVKP